MVFRGVDIKTDTETVSTKETDLLSTKRNVVTEKVVKWKVENTWGSDKHYAMSHDWFVKHVYAVVVKKDMLSDKEKKRYETLSKKENYVEKHFTFIWD